MYNTDIILRILLHLWHTSFCLSACKIGYQSSLLWYCLAKLLCPALLFTHIWLPNTPIWNLGTLVAQQYTVLSTNWSISLLPLRKFLVAFRATSPNLATSSWTEVVRCQPCNCALVGAGEHPTSTQRSYSTLHGAGHASHRVHIVPGCARVSLYGR